MVVLSLLAVRDCNGLEFEIVQVIAGQARALRVASRGLTYKAPLLSLCSFRSTEVDISRIDQVYLRKLSQGLKLQPLTPRAA